MKKLISEKLPRILKNKRKLENTLNVKITNRGKEVYIEGDSIEEYTAEKVIEAIEMGFPISVALSIKEDDASFEVINIKDHTPKKNFGSIRSRIIGKNGKTLKTLSQLTGCHFEIKDNFVGIIGDPESIENAQTSIILIIQGSKQANVYSYLEKHHIRPPFDLGLKNAKDKL